MHEIVAGALFDFIGFLTTRSEVIKLGASELAPPALEALEEWAKSRGLNLDPAAVVEWQDQLTE